MHELLNIAPCGVLLFDDGGKILEVNTTLAHWLGYQTRALENESIDVILSVACRVFYNTHFFPMIKLHSRADEIFLTLVSKQNQSIPMLVNAVRQVTPAGIYNFAVFMPVFERKKFEEQLLASRRAAEKALEENEELQNVTRNLQTHSRALERQNQKINSINRDLVQFNKIISHDLQEPIRKIRLFADMMLKSEVDNLSSRSKNAVEKIQKAAEHLDELTGGLQQYIKVDEDVRHQTIDLNDCILEAVENVKNHRNFRDVKLFLGQLPCIEGHRVQLQLLFYHIVDNAVKFRSPARSLEITVEHTLLEENLYRLTPDRYEYVEHVKITFSDNGSGFDHFFKEQLFQLGKKFHSGHEGLGLGLTIMKKVVTNHGGTIAVESEPDRGTDVILLLPVNYIKP